MTTLLFDATIYRVAINSDFSRHDEKSLSYLLFDACSHNCFVGQLSLIVKRRAILPEKGLS